METRFRIGEKVNTDPQRRGWGRDRGQAAEPQSSRTGVGKGLCTQRMGTPLVHVCDNVYPSGTALTPQAQGLTVAQWE